jgi:hypothetical protein
MYLIQAPRSRQLALLALLLQTSDIARKVQSMAFRVEKVGEGRAACNMKAPCLLGSCLEETRSCLEETRSCPE